MSARWLTLIAVAALVHACSGGGGSAPSFGLIQFLPAGQDNLERNAELVFRFSEPIDTNQDLFERIAVRSLPLQERAVGMFLVSGEVVTFLPRYPEKTDRSDSGLAPSASYSVFLKGGPDSLASASGARIALPQDLPFQTSDFFQDPAPFDPPRALRLIARDTVTGDSKDLSRLDPRPEILAAMDSSQLLAGGRVIDPGAGGPPYSAPWSFELAVDEPLDPATVVGNYIQLWEIRHDALQGAESADPGHFGDPVAFRVPLDVRVVQHHDGQGQLEVYIQLIPQWTLLDDTRYRLRVDGRVLGIDHRKQFVGDNGLTGDGTTINEPGGLGYVTEFLVADRPGIETTRLLEYEPPTDGVDPEDGSTSQDPSMINRVPYNEPEVPSCAVGLAPIFGDGRDGSLVAGPGTPVVLDTGDVPNELEIKIEVIDPDPDDSYNNQGLPTAGLRVVKVRKPTEFNYSDLTVSSTGVLQITGANPARIRVTGIVDVRGTIDARGVDGLNGGSGSMTREGGKGGPGGHAGGDARAGLRSCNIYASSCTSFQNYLNQCSAAKNGYPFSRKGEGPGRGNHGGEAYQYYYKDGTIKTTSNVSGTGGGGGGHAFFGEDGDDVLNSGGAPGTPGPACDSSYRHRTSSVIGARGLGGPAYGDRMVLDLLGGSGGGGGGALHQPTYSLNSGSGGSGGGGGGALEILARGAILVPGGTIDVSGGDGGKGALITTYSYYNYRQATGGGGGGAGGSLALVSGDRIEITGAIDATGGKGGEAAHIGTSITCGACNAGGAGSKGFLLLMDPDGIIDGMGYTPGDYDAYDNGVLTIRSFDINRFAEVQATTKLFRSGAANPSYLDLDPTSLVGQVAHGQRIDVYMSSARPYPDEPDVPDLSTETPLIHVATLVWTGAGVNVEPVPGAAAKLHPDGAPNRESFLRVVAKFDYDDGVQAAAGPFGVIDRVVARMRVND